MFWTWMILQNSSPLFLIKNDFYLHRSKEIPCGCKRSQTSICWIQLFGHSLQGIAFLHVRNRGHFCGSVMTVSWKVPGKPVKSMISWRDMALSTPLLHHFWKRLAVTEIEQQQSDSIVNATVSKQFKDSYKSIWFIVVLLYS